MVQGPDEDGGLKRTLEQYQMAHLHNSYCYHAYT
jgi:hypothetical protein